MKYLIEILIFTLLSLTWYGAMAASPSPTPTQTPLTVVQKQTLVMTQLANIRAQIETFAKYEYGLAFEMQWHNQNGLTAQQVLTAFGKSCKNFRDSVAAHVTMIKGMNPSWIAPPEPSTVTVNADGTCTVN